MRSGFKSLFLCLSFCTREDYPSSTNTDDNKGIERDPETNAHGKFLPVFNAHA